MGTQRGNRVSVKTENTQTKCSAQVIPAGRKSASEQPPRVTCTWASSQGYPPKGICDKKSEKTNNKLPWKSEGDKIMVCIGKGNEFKAIKERTRGTFRHSREQNAEKDWLVGSFRIKTLESAHKDCYLLTVFLWRNAELQTSERKHLSHSRNTHLHTPRQFWSTGHVHKPQHTGTPGSEFTSKVVPRAPYEELGFGEMIPPTSLKVCPVYLRRTPNWKMQSSGAVIRKITNCKRGRLVGKACIFKTLVMWQIAFYDSNHLYQ